MSKNSLLKTLIRLMPDSIFGIFRNPTFRYYSHFYHLQRTVGYSDRENFMRIAMEYVAHSKLEGDYLEFGVFEGANLIAAYHLAQRFGLTGMQFYAFDSFQGLPEIKGVDAGGFEHFTKGEFSADLNRFRALVGRGGVDQNKVHTVPGFFSDSLTEEAKQRLPLKKAAFVYIDCDLYESTVPVLSWIESYLETGTVIGFDDWFCYRADPTRGEARAFSEWLADRPHIQPIEYHKYGWQGNSFITHVKDR